MAIPEESLYALSGLSEVVLSGKDLRTVHDRIAQVAVAALPLCEGASITTFANGRPTVSAADDEWARGLDEMQYAEQEGPCLDCARIGNIFRVRDLAEETRWPSYVPRAVASGARSMTSLPLTATGRLIGALNVYSRSTDAFDAEAVAVAEIVASHVGLAAEVAAAFYREHRFAEQMQEAMRSRAVIEQAKGIIMGQRRCDADEAFAVLSKASQDRNRKLREIAHALVDDASRGNS